MAEKKKIGIIGAMAMETETLAAALEHRRTEEISGIAFHQGELWGVPCVVAQSGVGKVNAAVCAQTMILKYAPSLVVNTGAAGGVGPEIRIGDLVVASACVQHDMDTTALGEKRGEISVPGGARIEFPCDQRAASVLAEAAKALYGHVHRGIVATGDLFVADPEKNREIGRLFSAKATEMEGGSIAQVCYRNGVPCAVLRAISDNADDSGKVNFLEFARMASEKSAALLQKAIPALS